MVSIRGPKFKIIAALIALACLAAGVYFTFFHSRGFVKTTARIVSVERNIGSGDESDTFTPTVEYTVDGVTYTERLDESSSSYKVGKIIPVLYDPKDPSVVHSGSGFGIYLMVVSAAILVIVLLSTIRKKKSLKQLDELRDGRAPAGYLPSVQGEERELYFLTDLGTPKFGHRIEDRSRRVLYEAKMTKFAVTAPFGFDFIDHVWGTTTPHLVGHEEESHWDSLLIGDHNTFELDGVDIWKHLKQNGVSVESSFSGGEGRLIGTSYRILRDGREIARAESTGQYPHEEDAAEHKIAGAIPGQYFYRIWTREQNLDLLFMTLMAFARTGASDAQGGSFGALVGTIKSLRKDKN